MVFVERAQVDCVVSEKSAAEIVGLSPWTLRRQAEKGEGPRRLKLSARRVGYRMSDIEAWLKSRELVAG